MGWYHEKKLFSRIRDYLSLIHRLVYNSTDVPSSFSSGRTGIFDNSQVPENYFERIGGKFLLLTFLTVNIYACFLHHFEVAVTKSNLSGILPKGI